jgi:hypothetical protein
MKLSPDSAALDLASFSGMMLGLALLVVCYFVEDVRFLAVPAVLMLMPSLIYGMR